MPSCSSAPAPRQLASTDEHATATINYTSGTTARPKGVQMTHRNLWLNAVTFGWHMGVTDRDVYLHTLPMFHCNGWGLPFAITGMGARQVIIRKIDGDDILDRVDAEGVTFLAGAPAVVGMTLDAAATRHERGEAIPGAGRTRIVVAGAPPPSRIIERVEAELGWEFCQIYGLTETSPLLTVNRAPLEYDELDDGERAKRLSRAGVPAIGVRMRVDEDGELLARSNHVFEGYWEQPEESAKALVDGWFHTGDGGELDGAYVVISDRKKDVIISGGENVSSIEVEDCLFQHPAVAEAAVIGVPDDRWGETVKALVVLRPGESVTETELIEFCRERMSHYKCPTSIEYRDALARTATGKLQKFKLRQDLLGGPRQARELTHRQPGSGATYPPQRWVSGAKTGSELVRGQRWSIATLIAPLSSWVAERGEGVAPLVEAERVGEHRREVHAVLAHHVEVVRDAVLTNTVDLLEAERVRAGEGDLLEVHRGVLPPGRSVHAELHERAARSQHACPDLEGLGRADRVVDHVDPAGERHRQPVGRLQHSTRPRRDRLDEIQPRLGRDRHRAEALGESALRVEARHDHHLDVRVERAQDRDRRRARARPRRRRAPCSPAGVDGG